MRPVFVTGSERSGTTLLAVMLGRHPRLAVTPETRFCYRVSGGDWHRQASHAGLLRKYSAIPHIEDLDITAGQLEDRFRRLPPTPAALFQSLLEEYGERRGCDIVVEKSPHHVFFGGMLLRHFPDARLLHIFRDGRDTVQSILGTGWSWIRPDYRIRCSVMWRQCVAAGVELERNLPQRVLPVRYENLLHFPERELRSVCTFLGIDWDPRMLQPAAASDAVPDWEKKVKGKACERLDPGRAYAWKHTLPPRDRWLMNALMTPWLGRLSYPDADRGDCPKLLWGYYQSLRPLMYLLYSRNTLSRYERIRGSLAR